MDAKTRLARAEETRFDLDRIRLRFRDPKVETDFLAVTLRQSIHFIRAYLISGN